MEFYQLQDDLIIQVISRKQYDKLKELLEAQPKILLQVPLKNGQHGIVHEFFKYRNIRFYKKAFERLVITKLYDVRSEGHLIRTVGYWNYKLQKFEISSDHPDNQINGISSIKSAIEFLYTSDYYLIAQITD